MGKKKPPKIAFDTNILIYFLEGIEPYATKIEALLNSFMRGEKQGIISTINMAEVLTGFYAAKDERGATKTKSLFEDLTRNNFKIVPVTFKIADSAASLKAKRGGKLPDALIVATAINESAEALYSNDKDIQRFSQDIKIKELE